MTHVNPFGEQRSIGELFAGRFMPGAVIALFMMVMVGRYAHVRGCGADIVFSGSRMGRAFVKLLAVAITAVAITAVVLFTLWKDESLSGLVKFGLPLAAVAWALFLGFV